MKLLTTEATSPDHQCWSPEDCDSPQALKAIQLRRAYSFATVLAVITPDELSSSQVDAVVNRVAANFGVPRVDDFEKVVDWPCRGFVFRLPNDTSNAEASKVFEYVYANRFSVLVIPYIFVVPQKLVENEWVQFFIDWGNRYDSNGSITVSSAGDFDLQPYTPFALLNEGR